MVYDALFLVIMVLDVCYLEFFDVGVGVGVQYVLCYCCDVVLVVDE